MWKLILGSGLLATLLIIVISSINFDNPNKAEVIGSLMFVALLTYFFTSQIYKAYKRMKKTK